MAVPTGDDIQCPECDLCFVVIWSNDGMGGPEYCPRCGEYIQEVYLEGINEKI